LGGEIGELCLGITPRFDRVFHNLSAAPFLKNVYVQQSHRFGQGAVGMAKN